MMTTNRKIRKASDDPMVQMKAEKLWLVHLSALENNDIPLATKRWEEFANYVDNLPTPLPVITTLESG